MKAFLRILALAAVLFATCYTVSAQVTNTIYFMDRIPQRNQLNPAFQPACNLYIGCPGLSTIQLGIGNNSLTMEDAISYDSSIDS